MSVPSILPANAGVFEQALFAATFDELPVPFTETMDPATAPAAMLPFLAAHESVDLWFEDWPLARKRQMVSEAAELASLKGTRAGLRRYLAYVDAEIVDVIAHPARFAFGRAVIGITPVGHKPFVAHYLVRLSLTRPVNVFEFGKAVIGAAPLKSVDLEPIRRAKIAMATAKAPETQYSVTFAWRRRAIFADILPDEETQLFGGFINRTRL
ncbi:phage tail P2-like protein [Hoeflea marina]|uniref:Phage tail P2-like protein n=1 Tax=Hoeflea marina TaxID=274592 RepID=A0A317PDI3_9HYPH|nr:phage tail protein I [Hoeflea marina]PWV97705.1 phage tail P2-like protein [Hoeflea marina]